MAGNQPLHGSDLDPVLNKSAQTAPVPREYNRHQRHAKLARYRHTNGANTGQLGAFINSLTTRLTPLTAAQIFAKVTKYGAARVKAAVNAAALP